jgi:Rod binding domain-containing protein
MKLPPLAPVGRTAPADAPPSANLAAASPAGAPAPGTTAPNARPAGAPATAAAQAGDSTHGLKHVADEFERLLLVQMLRTSKVCGGEKGYGSMMVDALADGVLKGGGLGLSASLVRSLEQSVAHRQPAEASAVTRPTAEEAAPAGPLAEPFAPARPTAEEAAPARALAGAAAPAKQLAEAADSERRPAPAAVAEGAVGKKSRPTSSPKPVVRSSD